MEEQENVETTQLPAEDDYQALWEAAEEKANAAEGVAPDAGAEEELPSDGAEPVQEEPQESEADSAEEEPAKESKSLEDVKPEGVEEQKEIPDDFRAKAKELGLEIEDGKIGPGQWFNLRQEKREMKAKLAEKEQLLVQNQEKFHGQLQQILNNVEKEYGHFKKMDEAYRQGDLDAVAQALGAKDFGELATNYAKGTTPEQARLYDLERQLQAQKEQQRQAEAQQQQAYRQRQQQAQWQRYFEGVANTLSEYTETRELARDKEFLIQVGQEHQRMGGGSVEEAAKLVLDRYRTFAGNIQSNQPSVAEGAAGGAPETAAESPRKRRTKTVSQNQATAAVASTSTELDPDDPKWFDFWARKAMEG